MLPTSLASTSSLCRSGTAKQRSACKKHFTTSGQLLLLLAFNGRQALCGGTCAPNVGCCPCMQYYQHLHLQHTRNYYKHGHLHSLVLAQNDTSTSGAHLQCIHTPKLSCEQ